MKPKITWTLVKVPISELKEFDKNPRRLSKEMKKHLAKSLEDLGLIDKPCINQDNQIIGGHQRIRILLEEGEQEVECWMPNRLLDDKEVERICLTLNKVGGEFDFDMLANQFDIEVLLDSGFTSKDFHDEKTKPDAKPKIILEFDNDEDMETASEYVGELSLKLPSCKIKFKR